MNKLELYHAALGAELRSQKMYATLARSFHHPETSAFFNELVRLEKNHEQKLREAFAAEFPDPAPIGEIKLGRELQELDFSDPQALLEYAISREDYAREQYLALAEQIEDAGLKALALRLAAEEEGHKSLLLAEMSRIQGALRWFDPSELAGLMED